MLGFLKTLFKVKIREFQVLRPFTMEVGGELTMFEPMFGTVVLADDKVVRRLVRAGYLARTGKTFGVAP